VHPIVWKPLSEDLFNDDTDNERWMLKTYRYMNATVQVPVGVGEQCELWWDAFVMSESVFPSILVPPEQVIDKAILLERVIGRALDCVQ
jgi:hypothetical protein